MQTWVAIDLLLDRTVEGGALAVSINGVVDLAATPVFTLQTTDFLVKIGLGVHPTANANAIAFDNVAVRGF